jgi:predicted dehydrogenase
VTRIRIAAIGASHWHSLHDAAYLRLLAEMGDVEMVGLQDADATVAAERATALGGVPVFTDYRAMLDRARPDFVVALGEHRDMAATAHFLLDHGYPFMMEKPMGVSADEVQGIADMVAQKHAFVAVPLSQRYQPFVARARQMLEAGRFGPLSHAYFRLNRPTSARYPAWHSAWMLDPARAGGGCLRNLGSHLLDLFVLLTGEDARVVSALLSARVHASRWRTTPPCSSSPPAAWPARSRSATPCPTPAAAASGSSPAAAPSSSRNKTAPCGKRESLV